MKSLEKLTLEFGMFLQMPFNGLNILCNKLHFINRKINLDLQSMSYWYYKKEMKQKFPTHLGYIMQTLAPITDQLVCIFSCAEVQVAFVV